MTPSVFIDSGTLYLEKTIPGVDYCLVVGFS